MEDKFDLPRGRSRSRSLSRSSKSSRSLSKSRSSKSPSKSRSPRKYRVRSPSRSSYSSQSRSRSKSLPKAYSVGDERSVFVWSGCISVKKTSDAALRYQHNGDGIVIMGLQKLHKNICRFGCRYYFSLVTQAVQ